MFIVVRKQKKSTCRGWCFNLKRQIIEENTESTKETEEMNYDAKSSLIAGSTINKMIK